MLETRQPLSGIVSGLLYQVVVMVRSSGNIVSSGGSVQGLAQSFSVRVGLGLAGGEKGTDWLFTHARPIAVGLGAVVLCSLVTVGVFFGGSLRVRLFTLAAAGFCAVCYLVPVWLRGLGPSMQILESGGRQPLPGRARPFVGEHHIRDRGPLGKGA